MKFNKRTLVPISFTIAALAAGLASILCSANGQFFQAAQLIMLSMVLDGLDGKLARTLKATSPLGAELDTFVDFCSFGVAPSVLAYQMALQPMGVVGDLLAVFLTVSGALRLSRFRVIDPNRGGKGFVGLPITVAGGWVALWGYLESSGALEGYGASLQRGALSAVVWSVTALFALLQVSRVRYPKSTKDALVFAAGVLLVVALFLGVRIGPAAALGLCGYAVYYGIISPILRSLFPRNVVETPEEPALLESDDAETEEQDHPLPLG